MKMQVNPNKNGKVQHAVPCCLFRGGTSKGLYFLAEDLPQNADERDQVLLRLMGSPDPRQIDGLGGAHPLTSKVAIVSKSERDDADVDYLFVQVVVDKAQVSTAQNCGNILAGVGPFAIEKGLVPSSVSHTDVRIHMLNTGANATARVETPGGMVNYQGNAQIDGVPGSAAPIFLDFLNIAGSSCKKMFPTGNAQDVILDVPVTCIDNGMPVVLINAQSFGLTGAELPSELEANEALKANVEAIRLEAGKLMNLGEVSNKTVPKMSLISPALQGGLINTRTFIPHRVHDAIGVLGSVSVATACVLSGTVANELIQKSFDDSAMAIEVEHPTGQFTVEMEVSGSHDISQFYVKRAALLRTARLLMRGEAMLSCE
ncbi:4-oxalomesaconate tautomerase [Alteromonas sp. 38]|uniref:4-oxalomesaconate tautomerase n=1 Tax=unclassified Alteromonas TaxID=2614992 RepID=UPI0012F1A5E8|nr:MULTISPECIES: 4-oxalomesaconate tautomerase [unclassified Alteromonas]CAD5282651.1 4-oxalomesaconate tautomerase [Alteromonas sp. 154]VXB90015.1 4-oxalomesaconate tautomerase [Alteromonas sp. 38]